MATEIISETLAKMSVNTSNTEKPQPSSKLALCDNSRSVTPTTRTAAAVSPYLSKEGGVRFLHDYNPDNQQWFSMYPKRCFMGNAPRLSALSAAHGWQFTSSWVQIQIDRLAKFAGSAAKLDGLQSKDTADAIVSCYGFLSAAELMLFFQWFKGGRYGKFYGAVDPMTITSALYEFCKERVVEISKYEALQRDEARKTMFEGTVTREEYERIRKAAESGDEKAIAMLKKPDDKEKQQPESLEASH